MSATRVDTSDGFRLTLTGRSLRRSTGNLVLAAVLLLPTPIWVAVAGNAILARSPDALLWIPSAFCWVVVCFFLLRDAIVKALGTMTVVRSGDTMAIIERVGPFARTSRFSLSGVRNVRDLARVGKEPRPMLEIVSVSDEAEITVLRTGRFLRNEDRRYLFSVLETQLGQSGRSKVSD